MDYYSVISGSYDGLHKEEQLKKLNIIKKYIKVKKYELLLDIGCGTGISKEVFDCKILGIDNSKAMVDKFGKSCFLAEAENLPFKDNMFDIILCITAIHNFNNMEKAVNEIKRVGKRHVQIAISLLKKANNFNKIKGLLLKNFDFKVIDEEKDIIFVGGCKRL